MPEPDFRPPAWLLWVELASSPLIAALGGYVCVWIARRRPLQHAIALVAVIMLMGAVSVVTDAGEKPLWSSIALPVLACVGALLGARLRLVHVRVSAPDRRSRTDQGDDPAHVVSG